MSCRQIQITRDKDVLTSIKALWLQQMIGVIIDYSVGYSLDLFFFIQCIKQQNKLWKKKCPSQGPRTQSDVFKLFVFLN